jgi:hypothetical protein
MRSGVAVLAGAVLIVVTAGAGSSAANTGWQTPPPIPIPTLPKPPKVPENLPGEKVEKFKLVFEGTSHADRLIDGGGDAGPGCKVQLHDDIQEDVTFGRGKGVTMEFVRFKDNGHTRYGFQRSGRTNDSTFNVVGKISRTASGAADLVQEPSEPITCPALQHADLSENPACGKTITDNAAWGLKVKNDHFVPRPAKPLGGAFISPDPCGAPPAGSAFAKGGEEELFYQWPVPASMGFEPIPLHKMFDTRFKAFKVEFKALNLEQMGTTGAGGSLVEHVDDHGTAEATIRFIRQ